MSPSDRGDRFEPRRFQPLPLFLERLAAYWTMVGKSWKTIADWTVWLYLLVPAAWIGGSYYLDLLRHPPEWMVRLPAAIPLTLLGWLVSGGWFRTLAETGDGLLLNRHEKWKRGFTALGLAYTLIVQAAGSLAAIALMLPLWRSVETLRAMDLSLLAVFTPLWSFGWTLLRDGVSRTTSGWTRPVLLAAMRMAAIVSFTWISVTGAQVPLFLGGAAAIAALCAVLLGGLRLSARGTFMHELEMETKAYDAAIGWMLKMSMDQAQKPRLSRPLLLPRSGRMFRRRDAVGRLSELWIKSLIRRHDDLRLVVMFAGLGASALLAVPLPLSIAVWAVLPWLLIQWLKGHWKQWLKAGFIALFHWEKATLEQAGAKGRFWIVLPVVLMWGLLIGVRLGLAWGGAAWIGAAVMPAAGWFYMRAAHFGLGGIGGRKAGRAPGE